MRFIHYKGVASRGRARVHWIGWWSHESWKNLCRAPGYRAARGCARKHPTTGEPCKHPHHARGLCRWHYDVIWRVKPGYAGRDRYYRSPGWMAGKYRNLRKAYVQIFHDVAIYTSMTKGLSPERVNVSRYFGLDIDEPAILALHSRHYGLGSTFCDPRNHPDRPGRRHPQ